jgi:hypothetical protein
VVVVLPILHAVDLAHSARPGAGASTWLKKEQRVDQTEQHVDQTEQHVDQTEQLSKVLPTTHI